MPEPIIDVPLVRELVTDQFPQWAGLPVTPVEIDGWDNRTFHLGDDLSVRLPSAEAYAAQVEKEQHWLPLLAPHLPLPIPTPVARGVPGRGYPWNWSVYRWLDGENASAALIDDRSLFANSLARFLIALQKIDPAGGPPPGTHNFFRGGPLSTYDKETRVALADLRDVMDTRAATEVWEAALEATWHGEAVWLHGDVSATNLLATEGLLSAVIDFGCSGVGDPACDLTIAWTFFSGASREAFRATLLSDEASWARARGWALWKGLITVAEHRHSTPSKAETAQRVIDSVLSEHAKTL